MTWTPPPLPPDRDRPTADPATWLRSFPLRWGVVVIAGGVLLSCLLLAALVSSWPLVVLAIGCSVATIPLAYLWLEPWHRNCHHPVGNRDEDEPRDGGDHWS